MRLSKISGACFTWHSLWVWMLDKATTTTTTSKSSSLPQLMSMDGYIKHLLFVFVATIFPPPHSRVVCCVCAWPTDVLQVCFYVDGWTQLRGNVSDWPIPHFFQYTPNTLKYKYITTKTVCANVHQINLTAPERSRLPSHLFFPICFFADNTGVHLTQT